MAENKIRIKSLRKEKQWTQDELAKKIGVSKLSILRWENGERIIKSDIAQKIADEFGVWVPYLLGNSKIRTEERALQIAEANKRINKSLENNPASFEMSITKSDEHELLYYYSQLDEPFKTQVRLFSRNMWELQKEILKKDN